MRHPLVFFALAAGVCGLAAPAFAQQRFTAAEMKPTSAAKAPVEPKFGLVGFRRHAMIAANCGPTRGARSSLRHASAGLRDGAKLLRPGALLPDAEDRLPASAPTSQGVLRLLRAGADFDRVQREECPAPAAPLKFLSAFPAARPRAERLLRLGHFWSRGAVV